MRGTLCLFSINNMAITGVCMSSNEIKNVVFDVGNVIVRWAPLEIARLTLVILKTWSLELVIFSKARFG